MGSSSILDMSKNTDYRQDAAECRHYIEWFKQKEAQLIKAHGHSVTADKREDNLCYRVLDNRIKWSQGNDCEPSEIPDNHFLLSEDSECSPEEIVAVLLGLDVTGEISPFDFTLEQYANIVKSFEKRIVAEYADLLPAYIPTTLFGDEKLSVSISNDKLLLSDKWLLVQEPFIDLIVCIETHLVMRRIKGLAEKELAQS